MKISRHVLAFVLTAAATVAQAAPYGAYGHRGLNVHLELGLGTLRTQTDGFDPEFTVSGWSGEFAASVGAALTPQLGLGAELWDVVASSPDVDDGTGTYHTDGESNLTLVGFGPKLTWWLAPESANLYLSATPSLTWLTYDLDGDTRSNKTGLGLRLAVGKEWWLGRSGWGFGVSGQVHLAYNRDRDFSDVTWRTAGGGVNFSVGWH